LATAPEEYRAKYKDRAITLRENVAPGLKAEAINDSSNLRALRIYKADGRRPQRVVK
jgi:hypothetical protein